MSKPWPLVSLLAITSLLVLWPVVYAGEPACGQLLQDFVRAYQCGVGRLAGSPLRLPSEECTAQELYASRPVLTVALAPDASSPAILGAVSRIARELNLSVSVQANSTDTATFDVAIMDASQLGALLGGMNSSTSRLAAIDSKLLGPLSDEHYNGDWYSVDATLRLAVATYGALEAAVAFSGSGGAQLLYRKDMLQAAGVKLEQLNTWAGLLKVVNRLTNKDLDDDGKAEYPFCWNIADSCGPSTLLSIVTPFLQARGRHEGFLLDIPTNTLLLNSSAMKVAMSIFQRLQQATGPSSSFNCLPYNELFLTGRCAITFSTTSDAFKYYSSDPRSRVRGLFSVALAPGSDVILDRNTMQLVPCDAESCPHASMHELEERHNAYDVEEAGQSPPNDYSGLVAGTPPSGSTLVNRAPYLSDVFLGVVSADLPPSVRVKALNLLQELVSFNSSWQLISTLGSGVTPFRYEHWEMAGDVAPKPWLEAGYDATATSAYLQAIDLTVSWGGNAVAPLQLPGQDLIMGHLKQSIAQLARGQSSTQAAQQLNEDVMGSMMRLYSSWDQFMGQYRACISYQEGLRRQAVPLPEAPQTGSSSISHNVAIIVSCVLGSITLGLVIWLLLSQARRRHRDGLGRVKPPEASSDTTLLVAVMQDMDLLLEDFPSDVQERTVEIWNSLAAGCLKKFTGYQMPSSKPGILHVAFYSPGDAAMFALRFQKLLLMAKWPKQVLDHPAFAPVYMEPLSDVSLAASDKQMALDAVPSTAKSYDTGKPPVEDMFELRDLNMSQAAKRKASTSDLFEDASKCLTFGQQCAASWATIDATAANAAPSTLGPQFTSGEQEEEEVEEQLKMWKTKRSQSCRTQAPEGLAATTHPKAVLVSRGPQVCISVCAVCASPVSRVVDDASGRMLWSGEPMSIAHHLATCGQGSMILVPQQTFRQLPVEVMSEKHLFCHFGEYLLFPGLPPLDVYLTLDKSLLGLLSTFKALDPSPMGMAVSPGVLAAPVERAAMVFTHIVGVQALLAWNYDVTHAALDIFTRLAQNELRNHAGYLVEHVSGFMLSAFQQPGAAILWALKLQELMIQESWSEELLSHEMCEEVIVSSDSRDQALTDDARVSKMDGYSILYRGPRLKTGIDLGPILSALNTVTGRMAYRGKVMNRAARIASVASSGQVLCSSEALAAAFGPQGITLLQGMLANTQPPAVPGKRTGTNASSFEIPASEIANQTLTGSKPAVQHLPASGAATSAREINSSSAHPPAAATPPQAIVQAKSLGLFQLKGIAERIEVFHCFHERPNLDVIARRPSTRFLAAGVPPGSRKDSMLLTYASKNSSNAGSHARKGSNDEPQPRRLSQGLVMLEHLYAQGLGNDAPSSSNSSLPDTSVPWTASTTYKDSPDCFPTVVAGHKPPVQSPAPASLVSHLSGKGGVPSSVDEGASGPALHALPGGSISAVHQSRLQNICEDMSDSGSAAAASTMLGTGTATASSQPIDSEHLRSSQGSADADNRRSDGHQEAHSSPVPRGGADHPRLPRAARAHNPHHK